MEYYRKNQQIVARVDAGEELICAIRQICEKEDIASAFVQGIGFSEELKLRVYRKEEKHFCFKTFAESMELTDISGNVFVAENGIYPHIHVTGADKDMNIKGGHLISCIIGATAELLITISDISVTRDFCDDQQLGLMKFANNSRFLI